MTFVFTTADEATVIQIKGRGGYRPRHIDCEGQQQDEILQKTGITYRQLDYWTRSGRLKCHWHLGGKILYTRAGSGSTCCWLPDQIKIIGRVAALLPYGFELEQCFKMASDLRALMPVLAQLLYIEADLIEEAERKETAES